MMQMCVFNNKAVFTSVSTQDHLGVTVWGVGGEAQAYLGNQESRQVDFADHLAAPVTLLTGLHVVLTHLSQTSKLVTE